jgi:hypothetical protein
VSVFIYCLLYFLAGFIQEVLITSYHRCVYSERNLLASILAALITVVSLLVITGILQKIFDPLTGALTYLYVVVFAGGKGLGAYGSLSWWSKKAICDADGDCQRRS